MADGAWSMVERQTYTINHLPSAISHVAAERSDKCERGFSEVAAEQLQGIGAEPAVDDLCVDGSEVGFERDVAGIVLERRILRIRIEVRRRPVEAAVHAAAHHHHHGGGAVIGALAAIFADAPAELREAHE